MAGPGGTHAGPGGRARQTIVFAVDRAHAEALLGAFKDAGGLRRGAGCGVGRCWGVGCVLVRARRKGARGVLGQCQACSGASLRNHAAAAAVAPHPSCRPLPAPPTPRPAPTPRGALRVLCPRRHTPQGPPRAAGRLPSRRAQRAHQRDGGSEAPFESLELRTGVSAWGARRRGRGARRRQRPAAAPQPAQPLAPSPPHSHTRTRTLTCAKRVSPFNPARAGQLLTEGFDSPRVDAVFMARPTRSTGLYTQVGLGSRVWGLEL